jgi:hypothetical protein
VKYEEDVKAAQRKNEQTKGTQFLSSQSLFLTPQKGFHVFTEPMVDAYCNNPKLVRARSPRKLTFQRKHWFAPILTIPLSAGKPYRKDKFTASARPGSLREATRENDD